MYYDELVENTDDLFSSNKITSPEIRGNCDKYYEKCEIIFKCAADYFNNTMSEIDRINNKEEYNNAFARFKTIWDNGNIKKRKHIELFGSGKHGSRIRNAETGNKYPHLVGSSQEYLYFKISDSTCRFRKEPLMLYYDNPEQYERHQFTVVNQTVKEQWLGSRNKQ